MSDPIPPAPAKFSAMLALKIFAVVTLFLAAQEGTQAFVHAFDWSHYTDPGQFFVTAKAVATGCLYGALQGALRGVQVLLAFWSGPTLWTWLGPILAGAAAMLASATKSLAQFFKRTPATNK